MTRFGLVLGGGGYAGTAFHAGVLTALARAGWDAREAAVIVGTSAGATSAALIGAGFPPHDYVRLVLQEPVSAAAADVMQGMGRLGPAPRMARPRLRPAAPALLRQGLRSHLPIGVLIAAALPAGTVDVDQVSPGYGPRFDQWPQQPVWMTAVDLVSGQRAVFGRTHRASVAAAVAASVAIPGYFAPVVIDGVPYVDGGAWSTHHADLVADLGLDLVLVSAPSSSADSWSRDPANVLRLGKRRQLQRELTEVRRLGARGVVFQPDRAMRDVIGVNSMSLDRRRPVAIAAQALAARVIRQAGIAKGAGGL